MPRRPPPPPPPARRGPRAPRGRAAGRDWQPGGRRPAWVGLAVAALASAGLGLGLGWQWWALRPERLRAGAEAAARAGDRPGALAAWGAVNATRLAGPATRLAEARAALELGRAARAEVALRRASEADPGAVEPWRLRLELLRVGDRPVDAVRVGWQAYRAVPPGDRREVLRGLTLALLADVPEDDARRILARWVGADPAGPDVEARVDYLRRVAARPRSGDPGRAARVAELEAMLGREPGRLDAREALVSDLADAGEPDRGRRALAAWPGAEAGRDARYWRLRGRWDLDYDGDPAAAAAAFRRALSDLPHDWKTRARLARALHALGRKAEARREADAVGRTREALDPRHLGPRLAADLGRPDDPAALADLGDLCRQAGLGRLSEAWAREAAEARARGPVPVTVPALQWPAGAGPAGTGPVGRPIP